MRIAVLGYLVRGPLGGLAWHHLQYVRGLADLGHEVCFLEDSGDYASCYDPRTNAMSRDAGFGLAFADAVLQRLGLSERWAYFDAHQARWSGPFADRARAWCSAADVLLNLSGSNPLRPWHLEVPHRVLIDTDPVFTQIRHLESASALSHARLHTAFFSFGANIAAESCVPDDGLPWLPTRQPVVLDLWPVTEGRPGAAYTTVMQWDSYAAREHAGRRFGMKSESFAPYLDLPRQARAPLELSVGASGAVQGALSSHGWRVQNPLRTAGNPFEYQEYIRCSKAEFTVAKHGYVVSRSGWFSERSAAYLASGRPVVTQNTAFDTWLPTGEGVLVFDSPAAALDALAAVDARYEAHCRAARLLAEEYFDSRRVLSSVLDRMVRGGA